MMDINKLLAKAIAESKIPISRIAERSGVSRQYIYKVIAGEYNITSTTLEKICNAINISPASLYDENIEPVRLNRNVVKIPIYGEIPAGIPIEMIEDSFVEDYEELDASSVRGGQYFGLRVKGNSMLPKFENGDILILRQQNTCESGQFCAVSINHTECTFKKVIIKDSGITLMPLNPDYEPLFFTNAEVRELPITILGVVKEVRRKYF